MFITFPIDIFSRITNLSSQEAYISNLYTQKADISARFSDNAAILLR